MVLVYKALIKAEDSGPTAYEREYEKQLTTAKRNNSRHSGCLHSREGTRMFTRLLRYGKTFYTMDCLSQAWGKEVFTETHGGVSKERHWGNDETEADWRVHSCCKATR
jgi:hypothetical protein